jgi:hypothetical protein
MTSDGVTQASDREVMGVQELVNQQGQEGTCLTQVDRFYALHRLLYQGRL